MDVPHLSLAPTLADVENLAGEDLDGPIRVVLADDHAQMRRSLAPRGERYVSPLVAARLSADADVRASPRRSAHSRR
jgi:hypothetical protein